MSYSMLAVDRDIHVHLREKAEWERHGIGSVRVDSMSEAVEELSRSEFFFVSINADNINYLPMLPVLREMSSVPIFIITTSFSIAEQVEALHSGADAYTFFQGKVEDNVASALALLHQYSEQGKRLRKQPKVIAYRKLLILPRLRQVFCGDIEVPLTKKEYDIFAFLLANRGTTVSFGQIYRRVWGPGHEDADHNLLWNHIIRMRKKIAEATGEDGYIVTARGDGFRLPASIPK